MVFFVLVFDSFTPFKKKKKLKAVRMIEKVYFVLRRVMLFVHRIELYRKLQMTNK